jgi:hypothetical protein
MKNYAATARRPVETTSHAAQKRLDPQFGKPFPR